MQQQRKHFFEKPDNTKRVIRIFYTICAGLLVVDVFYHRHIQHTWEQLWGFYAIYGFVACVALVLIAKELRRLVMRDERYYGDE